MKLTKKKAKEIWEVYDTWLHSYLHGDVATYDSYFDDVYHFIGSTDNEEFLSRKETTKFFENTADQLAGKCDLRKETRILEQFGNLVFITHVFDAWFLNGTDYSYYGRFRFTNILHEKKEGWRFIYQHFSTPDSKTEAGETIGFEKAHAENQELREAVKRRTVELQQKNRELEIETALERVRAVAMAMHHTTELQEVIHTVHKELLQLGIAVHGGSFIAINNDIDTTLRCWGSGGTAHTSEEVHLPPFDRPFLTHLIKGIKKGPGFFTEAYIQEEKIEFFTFLFQHEPWSKLEAKQKKETLESPGGYTRSCCVSRHTSIFMINHLGKKFSEADNDILKRFGKVFEQAYTRFLDLKKAEAQTREAQIEAALERTRTQSMLMTRSEELNDISKVFHEQLLWLGIDSEFSFVWLPDEEKDEHLFWATWQSENNGKTEIQSKAINYPLDRKESSTAACLTDWSSGVSVHEYFIKPSEINNFFAAWEELLSGAEKLKPEYFPQGIYYTEAFMKYGCFGIDIRRTLSVEEKNILYRFAIEFERAYTRFLDLQKAEAQAREAQIQLALERVRAQTMAMHNSQDVGECVMKMFSELTALGVDEGTRFGIGILNHDNENNELWTASKDGEEVKMHIGNLDMSSHPLLQSARKSWKEQVPIHRYILEGQDLLKYYQMLNTAPDYKIQIAIEKLPEREFHFGFIFDHGFFYAFTSHEFQPELIHIIQRFSSLFGQTYRRYLDLVKAEAQAREAQIEAALERVRSRSMGMQKSEELKVVIKIVYQQLIHLKIKLDHAGFVIDYTPGGDWHFWIADERDIPSKITHPWFDSVWANQFNETKEKGGEFFATLLNFEEKNKFYKKLLSYIPGLPETSRDFYLSCPGLAATTVLSNNVSLYIENFSGTPYTAEENNILTRFARVFEQTYTRFLDLQKAEAQAREAQIQLALERVRARTMAMQSSEELAEVSYLLNKQVVDLGIPTRGCAFNIYGENESTEWFSNLDGTLPTYKTPRDNIFLKYYQAGQRGETLLIKEFDGERIRLHYKYLMSLQLLGNAEKEEEEILKIMPERQIDHVAYFKFGYLLFITLVPAPGAHDVFKRFAKEFEQTYTRFLDLQKAEAQAREAQIEAALEKVRSRSLAMHTTNELGEVVTVIVEKLTDLGVVLDANGVVLCTYFDNSRDVMHWIVSPDFKMAGSYLLPWFEHPIFREAWESKESGDAYFSKAYSVEDKNSFFEYAFEHSDYRHFPEDFKQWVFQNDKHILFFAWQKNSAILIPSHTGVVPSEEEGAILKRFARVFEQAYVRFLDLQKAEAQVREAQIEAALERVRSRTIGMQRSDELQEAAALMFLQIETLGVNIMGCGFNIWDDDRKEATAWMSGMQRFQPPFKTSSSEDIFHRIYEAAERGESLFVEEQAGDDLIKHYEYMTSIPVFKKILDRLAEAGGSAPSYQIMHCAFFRQGYLMFISLQPVVEAHDIFKRFAKVFEQTYTRFLDLKKVEAREREAIKQASLDRVRAEIASMRTTKDLERITPLIWSELTTLGVPFIRSGVFIMDEEQQQVQVHLSTPEGKAIAAFLLNYEASVQSRQIVSHWREMKIFKDHMDEVAFAEYAKNLVQQGALAGDEKYVTENHPTDLYLHFLPFAQGMLYVGNNAPLKEVELQLVQGLADAFSTAYARYEDFNKLEAAKLQVDRALVNLKQAQQQLVQSEKMASLGELTAGIAHEIQNPLNFVNNFSEVSSELVDEMNEEIDKGNINDAKEIASDLKQNLEKITHHGKRAGEIVKGMLQHSRTSSGQKELTDINALADEYLRLAYHGLRAKDKSFNSKMETDFDNSIPKIEVVPQDIGRVILNLITNAFYAVNEKSKEGISGYEPTVSVSTKKKENAIEISVKDNGYGIPEHIKEKIFQPFFTTKPTGQGTGLGLSLSYDIVKAHGGELKVETKEGAGSEFVILLPI